MNQSSEGEEAQRLALAIVDTCIAGASSPMRDVSFFLAVFAVLFLIVAGVAWFRIIRKPDQKPPTATDLKRGGSAAMVLVIAFGLSAVAAVVAIVSWIRG